MPQIQATRIVIIGTGFGGLYTYLTLRKKAKALSLQITLINRTNHFLFTPMLHEVATGGLQPQNIVESIRQIIRKDAQTHFLEATVESIDTQAKCIQTTKGQVIYDQLVIATGATTNYYDTPGASANTFVLKDLMDAERLKQHVIQLFERLPNDTSPISLAIVGGGATGVELAGELSELLFETFHSYYGKEDRRRMELHLIHRSEKLLQAFHPDLRRAAAKILEKKGVKLHMKTSVTEVGEQEVRLSDGSRLSTQGVIWVSGVKPSFPNIIPPPLLEQARLSVDPSLRMREVDGVWVVGDCAASKDVNGQLYPMLAQVAVAQGRHVAENIVHHLQREPLVPFQHRSLGNLVSLGQYHAVADFSMVRISGFVAWFIWRTIYLSKFSSWSKRVRIAVDWTLNFFYPRDIVKWD